MAKRREHCVACGRHWRVVGPLSRRGKCEECALAKQAQAIRELAEKRGPTYEAWLASNATKEASAV